MIKNAQTEEIKFQPITTQKWLNIPFGCIVLRATALYNNSNAFKYHRHE